MLPNVIRLPVYAYSNLGDCISYINNEIHRIA